MTLSRLETELAHIAVQRSTLIAIEIALAVVLAYILASLFWALAAAPTIDVVDSGNGENAVAHLPNVPSHLILTEFDPFHRGDFGRSGQAATDVAPPETQLDVKLFGIRLADSAGGGSAIIRLQNYRHSVLEVGDEVFPGITLSEIQPGYVVLSRDGRRETLYLDPNNAPQATVEQNASNEGAIADVVQADSAAGSLFEGVGFRTRRDESGQISGVVVSAGEGSDFYQRTDLESGDVVVEVNGISVSEFGPLGELRQSLQNAASVNLVVERQGERKTVQLGAP